MRKKILAAIGAPILLASTLLAGSAAAKPSHKAVVKAQPAVCSTTCPSDEIFFHGIVQFLPSADSPKAFVIVQDKTVKNGPLACAQYSDGGEGPFSCTGTAHGTITSPGGSALTFTGTATFASNDGVITIAGSVPVGGKATITSCKEFDIPEAITTTGCTITNGSFGVTIFPVGSPPVYHINADIIINEVPGVGKDID